MKKTAITATEINKITENSPIREKAFFTIIRQSGLKPTTIKQLKIKHLERIRDINPPIPCKISVSTEIEKNKYGRHPTFIAEEATKYLKKYLIKRELKGKEKLTTESLLFTIHNKPDKQISIKEMNRTFKRTAHRTIKEKQNDFQLSDLRDFFKQKSKEMGQNHISYMMGNKSTKPNDNYEAEDDEFYKKLYNENKDALNTEQVPLLYTREIQIKELKKQSEKDDEYISNILSLIHEMDDYDPDNPTTPQIGDSLIELWQKATSLQNKTLLESWDNYKKYPKYIDIPLTLTNLFKHIIKIYEDLEKDEDKKKGSSIAPDSPL